MEYEYNYNYYTTELNSDVSKAINYLNYLKQPSEIINSQKAYEAIFLIAKCIGYRTKDLNFDIFIDEKIDELYGDILFYLYENHKSIFQKIILHSIDQPNKPVITKDA